MIITYILVFVAGYFFGKHVGYGYAEDDQKKKSQLE